MKNVAFVGLPNTGKSSLISKLTNKELYVANFSGATVEVRKYMMRYHHKEYCLMDIPGTMDLIYQREEEKAIGTVLENERIDLIVQVINSTQLKASLPLTLQLRNLQIPMICLLNFSDEAARNDLHIDTVKLSYRLCVPVLMVSAFNKEDTQRIMDCIEHSEENVVYRPLYNPETDVLFQRYAQIHEMKKAIMLFESHYPQRVLLERERAIESCMRYVTGSMTSSNMKTLKIDQFLLGTLLGKLVIAGSIVFSFIVFLYLGLLLSEVAGSGMDYLSDVLMGRMNPSVFRDFLSDVVFSAMGSLFSFLPLYMSVSAYLAVIEESGMMARFLLLSERMMRSFHFNGKSLISFMIAHGCNVPAVDYASTMEEKQMRLKTILLIPFCSCSARLPVYLMFASVFLKGKAVLCAALLVLLGIFCVLLLSELLECIHPIQSSELPVFELPVYRKVHWHMIIRKIMYQTKGYLVKLFRILFCVFAVVFLMMNVPVDSISLFEWISRHISSLYLPLGFGESWIYTASLLPGIIAKEAVAGTFVMLNTVYPALWIDDLKINLIYLVYVSLSLPCILSCAAIKNKLGSKIMLQSMILSWCISYFVSWLLYQFIMFF